MTASLATGFAGLDREDDQAPFVACLRLLGRLPGMAAIKAETLARLGLAPGMRVLEVGCGLGVEAAAMAGRVRPGGLVVALDASLGMLSRLEPSSVPGAVRVPLAGDATRLPLADASCDACRVERTLQHVADPGAALAEMARVTRPGGRVLALEPDWGTFVFDSGMRETARTVGEAWCDSFRSGWVGRRLPRLMAEAGLTVAAVSPRSLVTRDLAEAEAVYNLLATVQRAVAAGRLDASAGAALAREQRRLDAAGRFFASLTFFLVEGVKA